MPSWLVLLAIGSWMVAGCSVTSGLSSSTPSDGSTQVPVTVFKPEGNGPFPAVVIMHDCSGLGPVSSGAPGRWAAELVMRGYVAVLPDSFTTRGHPGGICTLPVPHRRADVTPERRARDAYWALSYARSLPYVNGRRVGLMGGSHGGTSALSAMAAGSSVADAQGGFAAAVALYPRCAALLQRTSRSVYSPTAPVLILIGEKDDWTPARHCQQLAEAADNTASPVSIKVYPGVQHSFDSPNAVRYVAARINTNSPTGRGATTGGDPVAWTDSIREVFAFFERHAVARTLDDSRR